MRMPTYIHECMLCFGCGREPHAQTRCMLLRARSLALLRVLSINHKDIAVHTAMHGRVKVLAVLARRSQYCGIFCELATTTCQMQLLPTMMDDSVPAAA